VVIMGGEEEIECVVITEKRRPESLTEEKNSN
jgi:hypothetical protein